MRTSTRTPITLLALLGALALTLPAAALAGSAGSGGASAPQGGGATGSGGTTQGRSAGQPATKHASYHGPVPVLTGASCYRIGQTRCSKNKHSVEVSGELVIRGHYFQDSVRVMFPGASTTSGAVDPIASPLHPTRHGWAVTVPTGAVRGRIYLENAAGKRSRSYGPITILAAPVTVSVQLPAGASPFDGEGMWIWYLSSSDGGNLAEIAATAKQAGISTLYIKSSDGTSFWPQFTPTLVQTLHSLGLRVCGWQYVYGADPAGEAAVGAEAVADGADCLVIDAESDYEGNYYGAQTFMTDLRAAIGPSYPLGLTSFPYVNFHESEPYSVFLGPGGAQYDLPQIYWQDIGTTPDAAYSQTYVENRIYGRPIVPIGQTFDGVSAAAMTRFRQLAGAYAALGFSWWSWQDATPAEWAELETPLTPATNIAIPTAWPALAEGSTGDQVIWMQEHLAAAYPSTPTGGDFDATTQTNLENFQRAHGIPGSGVTDAATWTALLELTPVVVQYPPPPPPPPAGSTGSSGSTGASGTSGSSGASGASGASGSSGSTGSSGSSGGTSA